MSTLHRPPAARLFLFATAIAGALWPTSGRAQDEWSDLGDDDAGGVTVYTTDGPSTLGDARATGSSVTVSGGP